jgi:anti-sigma factor RsiW
VAAGLPAPSGLEAHLASCEACRAELQVLQRALAVADAEMAGLLVAEPTPELAVRIRQAVSEPEPSPGWRFGRLWPAAATLLVALAVWQARGSSPPAHVAVAPGPSPAPSVIPRMASRPALEGSHGPAGPSRVDVAGRARGDGAPARSPSASRHTIAPEPEVFVPPGEGEALLRLVALVHRERLSPAGLAAAGRPSSDLPEPVPLEINPIEIVPLDPAETSGT